VIVWGLSARRATILALVAALMLAGSPLQPQPIGRNADLERIRAEIRKLKDKLASVKSQAKTAAQELEAVELELAIRTRELQIAIETQSRLEEQQQSIQAQIAALTPRIDQQKRFLSRRLVALYRLGGLSYVRLLLSIEDSKDPLEAISMLSYVVARDARAVSRFQESRKELSVQYAGLADKQRRITRMRAVVEERRQAVELARDQKERVLASLLSEGNQSERKLAELEEKARRLERLFGLLYKQSPVGTSTADVREFKGALGWPVEGKILEGFGRQVNPKFATVTISNGLKIEAVPGTEVRAVFQGTVLFSQWFKGYGNLIILDHGNRVFSLYGNLKSPAVSVGDTVASGQLIAGVSEGEEAGPGYLYFEIRQDNRPEDPRKWLR
jgi:septal ring factor EnvC (AmiA/AmiB activator)